MTPAASKRWPDDDVILYDGVCVFCSRWIRFVAARDAHRRFRFTAIQSAYGTRLARPSASIPRVPIPTPLSMAASPVSDPTPR
jgi:predicted DCC family thiol-disulfide oxidoreductase YuxK